MSYELDFSQKAAVNNLLATISTKLKKEKIDVFPEGILIEFLENSLMQFNEIPKFTFYTFKDCEVLNKHHYIISQGAILTALSSYDMIVHNKKFSKSYVVPTISEMLKTRWSGELQEWYEELKLIKGTKE